ncbi:MAG: hypothetical protein HY334_08865 [Armatimonadetes bacterium]|nr:hypothetical protein [Armatimonadota bacterium]
MRSAALAGPALVLLLVLVANAIQQRNSAAQAPAAMGVDVEINGNTATSVASVQSCTSAKVGDTFGIDLYVTNVQEIIAFELYFGFDGTIVEVVDHDLRQFLASASRSSVTTEKDPIPNSTGRHFLGAFDTRSPETGSGVLVRLTLTANAPGRSPATILASPPFSPILTNTDSQYIGDVDGDKWFDGSISQAEVAVGEPCSQPPPKPTPGSTPPPPDPTPTPGTAPAPTSNEEDPTPGDSTVLSIGDDLPAPASSLSDSPNAALGDDLPPSLPGLADSSAAGPEADTAPDSEAANEPDTTPGASRETALEDDGEDTAGASSAGEGGGSGGLPLWLIATLGLFALVAGAAGLLVVRSGRGAGWRG